MSEDNTYKPTPPGLKITPELLELRAKADELGVKYHHRAGVKKLKEAIANHEKESIQKAKQEARQEEVLNQAPAAVADTQLPPGTTARMLTPAQYEAMELERKKKEMNRLIRCRIQCMNPAKREWPGEIISVGSAQMGTFKKFIPYNGEPYHVPKAIFDFLKERKCRIGVKKRDKYGNDTTEGKLIDEYAIEVLPPLTAEELKDLARKQAMAAGGAE